MSITSSTLSGHNLIQDRNSTELAIHFGHGRAGRKGLLVFGSEFIAPAMVDVIAEAGDGGQAIDMARIHEPDVVVMDVRMPDVGGVEACRGIRDMRPKPR